MKANPPWLRAAVPGTSMAACQAPLTWLTTNAWWPRELSRYCPPALQLPAEPHDTEMMKAFPWRRAAATGTLMAVCQVPLTWLTTNAWSWLNPSLYCPPALQLPGVAHDTEAMSAFPPWLRAAVPGTSMAVPQEPLTWL